MPTEGSPVLILPVEPLNLCNAPPHASIPRETLVGIYMDGNGLYHGFLRNRAGRITTIDPPEAVNGSLCREY